MEIQADDVLNRWIEGVNKGDLEGVLSMYAEAADLLPTYSSEIRTDPTGIRRYFENVAKHDSVEVVLDDSSKVIQKLSDNIFSASGLYAWHFVDAGEHSSCMARYTYILDLSSEHPILHHHSSVVPLD